MSAGRVWGCPWEEAGEVTTSPPPDFAVVSSPLGESVQVRNLAPAPIACAHTLSASDIAYGCGVSFGFRVGANTFVHVLQQTQVVFWPRVQVADARYSRPRLRRAS